MTGLTARSAIEVAGLRKSFGDKVVLDGIDLRVAEGTVLALLGPNGAGKTTMVQILSTLIGADGGELRVAGLADEPLTSQETRLALLVARGLSNREVAAALFLSPKTIEHHLASVFRKRGFRSRTELASAFAAAAAAG